MSALLFLWQPESVLQVTVSQHPNPIDWPVGRVLLRTTVATYENYHKKSGTVNLPSKLCSEGTTLRGQGVRVGNSNIFPVVLPYPQENSGCSSFLVSVVN